MKNKIRIGFVLNIDTNTDHPSNVTTMTGISATNITVRGEPFISPFSNKLIQGKQNEYNLWILKSKKMEATSDEAISDLLSDVISIFENKKEEFLEIFAKYKSSYLQFYMYTDDYHIYLHLPHSLMSRLYSYGIDVIFDIYSLNDQDDEATRL